MGEVINAFGEHPFVQSKRQRYDEWIKNAIPQIQMGDVGKARVLCDFLQNDFIYVSDEAEWYTNDNGVWRIDPNAVSLNNKTIAFSDALIEQSYGQHESNDKKILDKFVNDLRDWRRRKDILQELAHIHFIRHADFNIDPNYLFVNNGMYDLVNFTLLPRNPNIRSPCQANVEYKPNVISRGWENIIDILFKDEDTATLTYFQKLCGIWLTGNDAFPRSLTILQTFYGEILMTYFIRMLGGYAVTLDSKFFTSRRYNPESELTKLQDKRLVYLHNSLKNTTLNVPLVNQILSGVPVTQKGKNGLRREFKPNCNLVMVTDSLPKVASESIFVMKQIQRIVIPDFFNNLTFNFVSKEQMGNAESMSGILNFALRGLELFYAEGLGIPDGVKRDTVDYKHSVDTVGLFISERLVKGVPKDKLKTKFVYECYQEWCRDENYEYGCKSIQEFMSELRKKAHVARIGDTGNHLWGYRFPNSYQPYHERVDLRFFSNKHEETGDPSAILNKLKGVGDR